MAELALFEGETPAGGEELSADRRRTFRQRQQVAAGFHPLMRTKTRPDLGTCGDCRFRVVLAWHSRSYPKCEQSVITNGAATDCRAWWPACERFEPKEQQ